MRIKHLLFAAFLLGTINMQAQVNSLFNLYCGSAFLSPEVIAAGDNNSVYVVSNSYSSTTERYISKIDGLDNVVWSKMITEPGSSSMDAYDMQFYNNELYLLTSTQEVSSFHYTLIKMDVNGNVLFSKNLTPPASSYSYGYPSLKIDPTYGVYVSSSMWYGIDLFALQTDGTPMWAKRCENDSIENKNPSFDICIRDNGDIIGCSKSESDMSVYCVGPNNEVRWAKRYQENDAAYTRLKRMVKINDDKYLICGYRINDFWMGPQTAFYAFMDGNGNFTDFRMINEITDLRNIFVKTDGTILMEGASFVGNRTLVTINTNGELLEVVSYSEGDYAYTFDNTYTMQNGYQYLVGGGTLKKLIDNNGMSCLTTVPINLTFSALDPSNIPLGSHFEWETSGTITNNTTMQSTPVTVTLVLGCASSMGIEETSDAFRIFPTMLHSDQFITVQTTFEGEISYRIMDMNGKMMTTQMLMDNRIPVAGLTGGMYVLQFLSNGDVLSTSKFMIAE